MSNIIGIDEVGRGSLVGPVVAASVLFINYDPAIHKQEDYDNFYYLLDNLNDSKKLSKKKMRELFNMMVSSPLVKYELSSLSNTVIDDINILEATLNCFKLLERGEEYFHIVDGNIYPLSSPGKALIKADEQILQCMAASIIAKVTRDDLMSKLGMDYPQYNWEKNAGYGTKEHKCAIMKYGVTPFHRLSFLRKMDYAK